MSVWDLLYIKKYKKNYLHYLQGTWLELSMYTVLTTVYNLLLESIKLQLKKSES